MPPLRWPTNRPETLLAMAATRMRSMCELNDVEQPTVTSVRKDDWLFGNVCAYYRPKGYAEKYRERHHPGLGDGIMICLPYCARPCGELVSRAWSWPGYKTDRTVFGVIAHELGHHFDFEFSRRQDLMTRSYGGELSEILREDVKESPLSGYCPNDNEWFAEMFRLFVTNPALLSILKPRTFACFSRRWRTAPATDPLAPLGSNCPQRILRIVKRESSKRRKQCT